MRGSSWKSAFALSALITLALLSGCAAPMPPMPRPLPFVSPLDSSVYFPWFPMSASRYGRGLGATYSSIAACQDAQQIGARWLYDWGPFPPTCPGVLSLPMVWDRNPDACPPLGLGNPILLWNEPANSAQWGGQPISPDEAIPLTHHLTEVCYPGRTFATPAQYNGFVGLAWMTAWWDGYVARYGNAPRVVVMALHCYGSNAEMCESFLSDGLAWAQARGLAVLVTEWGVPPPFAGGELLALAESDRLYHWMQAQPGISGEAFFAGRIVGDEWWSFAPPVTSLLDTVTGARTAWGRWYAAH